MKKLILFTGLIVIATTSLFAQNYTYRTTEYVGDLPSIDEYGIDITKDASGNMYAVGTVNNGANNDISLSKFDVFGNLIWEVIYNNGGEDTPIKVEIGESNNIYVTGNSQDGSPNKALIVKYNSLGILLWDVHDGGIAGKTLTDSRTTANGKTVLVGYYKVSSTDINAFVVKYNEDGSSAWSNTYDNGSSSNDVEKLYTVSVSSINGDVYTGGVATLTNNSGLKLMIKYNASGVQQWLITPSDGEVYDLISAGTSLSYNYYIVGSSEILNPKPYTAKFNSSGVLQWENIVNDGVLDGNAEVHFYNSNIYVAFRHNAGSSSPEIKDFFTKYNTAGIEQWTISGMDLNDGYSTPEGELAVTNQTQVLSFDGSEMYANIENRTITRYDISNGQFINMIFPISSGMYEDLEEVPDTLNPIKTFVNNGFVYLFGNGKFNSEDYSRIALSSYCIPVSSVSIDAVHNVCGNEINVSAIDASSARWDSNIIDTGSIIFSDSTALSVNIIANYTNSMSLQLLVRGEDENTCPTYNNYTITFSENPTPVITGDLAYCEGSNVTLDAGSGYSSYTWSNGESTQTSTVTAGTYSVEVEDANGCLGTSVSVVVVENPLPIVFLGNDTIICDDATLDIDAGSFASYTWNTGSDEATITVDEAGTYIVEVTDENGCTATDDIVVDLTVCIGIDEIGETYRIEVYPNPANDLLNVNYNIKANISELAVVDMFGRVLIQSTIDSNSQQFDVSSLNTGVYFVKIQWSGKTEIIKFIKQ